jgi:hypothetical protein
VNRRVHDALRGCDASAGRHRVPCPGDGGLERGHEQQDTRRRRARTHQADAPDLAGQRPHAGADLDVECFTKCLAHRGIVEAGRNARGVEGLQPLACGRQQAQAHRVHGDGKHPVRELVPRPARLKPLLFDRRQRFVERVDQRRRHRVVVLARDPVVLEQPEVEMEAPAGGAPGEGRRSKRDRRKPGRRADALLRAAVARIDARWLRF